MAETYCFTAVVAEAVGHQVDIDKVRSSGHAPRALSLVVLLTACTSSQTSGNGPTVVGAVVKRGCLGRQWMSGNAAASGNGVNGGGASSGGGGEMTAGPRRVEGPVRATPARGPQAAPVRLLTKRASSFGPPGPLHRALLQRAAGHYSTLTVPMSQCTQPLRRCGGPSDLRPQQARYLPGTRSRISL